ncbi:MAG: isoprenylcysteine carboxylmethyltransferase family protein [Candidatus Pacebacteria bacterium]|nr:isoprenylcysteine carboxylmethyltransferase family protein [Candidatus Paceibacterota bacterium]
MDTHEKVKADSSYAIHMVLSHSYTMFMLALVAGLVLHLVFEIPLFVSGAYQYLGVVLIIIGTYLVWWAQSTTRKTKQEMSQTQPSRDFARGPYKYSRNPTHIGLTLTTLGLGLILNSFFIFVVTIIASLISKYIFIKKEEALLEEKYGDEYREYKKTVSTWV